MKYITDLACILLLAVLAAGNIKLRTSDPDVANLLAITSVFVVAVIILRAVKRVAWRS